MRRSLEDQPRRAGYSAPALEKGLDIIELLAASEEPLAIGQIATRLGRSKSEIFRMVWVLETRGYLMREGASDLLCLSNRLFEVGLRTPRPRRLIETALPAMEQLSEKIGLSSHLVVINRGETVVIASATGNTDVGFALRLGYRRRAIDATSGRTILAFQTEEARKRLLAGETASKHFIAKLRTIASKGYLIARSHDIEGVTDVSAPILDGRGQAIAAIVIPCLKRVGRPVPHDRVAEDLTAACTTISAALFEGSAKATGRVPVA